MWRNKKIRAYEMCFFFAVNEARVKSEIKVVNQERAECELCYESAL